MGLEEDIREIDRKLNRVIRNQHTIHDSLPGSIAYAVLGIAMIAAVKSCNRGNKLLENSERTQQQQQVRVENVIGDSAPEKFYEINGQRFYIEIDGKPVEYIEKR
ncbi:MAG: hypothetical protein WC475_05090 [Candidatus Paceibacterota bacterium]